MDLCLLIFGGKLNAGNHFQAAGLSGLHGFHDPAYGIMVRNGDGRKAGLFCFQHQLRGGQRPVGGGGVGVQINIGFHL